jgi:hypothetical protein
MLLKRASTYIKLFNYLSIVKGSSLYTKIYKWLHNNSCKMAIAQVLGKQSLEELIFGIERDSKKAIDKGISQSTAHTLTPSGAIYELATLNTSSAQDAASRCVP